MMDFTDEQSAWIGENLARAVKQTARRCAEIAKLHDESPLPGGETAVDICIAISREFGLDEERRRWEEQR